MKLTAPPARRLPRLAALALVPLVAGLLVGPLPAGAQDTGPTTSPTPTAPADPSPSPTEPVPTEPSPTEPTDPSPTGTTPTDPATPSPSAPTETPTPAPAPQSDTATPTPTPTSTPTEDPDPEPEPVPLPMRKGDRGEHVRELQSRLHQRGLHYEVIGALFDAETVTGVKGFQKRRDLRATGVVNQKTWDLLVAATRTPTYEEMHNVFTPGPVVLGPGATGRKVRDLQARLKQRKLWKGDVTGVYKLATRKAVSAFQKERRIPVTGKVDARTLDRLRRVTRRPTHSELFNVKGAPLDRRCETGRVLCIDKTSRTLRWVVRGQVRQTMDARFGAASTPTREGKFDVYWKSRDHVSSLYGSPMPFAMFFSGGQAVHYSPDFAAVGYAGASHGCVNIRDRAGIARLFDKVKVGDKVIVYRS